MSLFVLETEQDMLAYLDPTFGHGVTADFIHNNVTTQINIIMEEEFLEIDEGTGIESTTPAAYCRSVDISNVAINDNLNVSAIKDVDGNILKAATNYIIKNIENDKTGFIILKLEKV